MELTTVSSNYHVQMNPSDVGNNDRYVVQEIIKVRVWQSCTGNNPAQAHTMPCMPLRPWLLRGATSNPKLSTSSHFHLIL